MPALLRITFHFGGVCGDVCGQIRFCPALVFAKYIERPTTVMAFDINGAFAAVKDDVIFVKAWLQSAMFKQNRDRLAGHGALKFCQNRIAPLHIGLAPF